VSRGDTVIWRNNDPFPHTVTGQSGAVDSKEIAANGSWRYKATKHGTFPYFWRFHSTMKGTLIVK
jgi:plastocyanin